MLQAAKVAEFPGTPADDSRQYLTGLARSVYSSAALNNDFYRTWIARPLELDEIGVFARNYGQFIRQFPEVLAIMILHTDNIAARTEYAKTLYSEMGHGQMKGVHSVLFDQFFEELSTRLGQPDALRWDTLVARHAALPETQALIEGEKELYARDSATAAGAQLALEWQAYTMLRQLYDGARNYMDRWDTEDGFHEACEYFYAHIGVVEKEHKLESLNGALEFDVDPEARHRIEHGFHRHLELFAAFWNGIARQFRSVVAA
jgi:pyrroloquinoline quinone (PQQ) biosynthesis protein C